MPSEKRILDYDRERASSPIKTRIIIKHVVGGIRFIDPPGDASSIKEFSILAAILAIVALMLLLESLNSRIEFPARLLPMMVAAIFAWVSWKFFQNGKLLANLPTSIEINDDGIILIHPLYGRVQFQKDEVKGISRDSAFVGASSLMNRLVITVNTIRYPMLYSRTTEEINWLIWELKRAINHPTKDRLREPAPQSFGGVRLADLPTGASYKCPRCGGYDNGTVGTYEFGTVIACKYCGDYFINTAVRADGVNGSGT